MRDGHVFTLILQLISGNTFVTPTYLYNVTSKLSKLQHTFIFSSRLSQSTRFSSCTSCCIKPSMVSHPKDLVRSFVLTLASPNCSCNGAQHSCTWNAPVNNVCLNMQQGQSRQCAKWKEKCDKQCAPVAQSGRQLSKRKQQDGYMEAKIPCRRCSAGPVGCCLMASLPLVWACGTQPGKHSARTERADFSLLFECLCCHAAEMFGLLILGM